MNAGSAGAQTEAGSTFSQAVSSPRQVTLLPWWAALVPSQEGMQAMQVLNPRLAALPLRQLGLVCPRQVALLPSWEATQVVWVFNPRLPALLPRHLMLGLPKQAPPMSPRDSLPQREQNTLEDSKL